MRYIPQPSSARSLSAAPRSSPPTPRLFYFWLTQHFVPCNPLTLVPFLLSLACFHPPPPVVTQITSEFRDRMRTMKGEYYNKQLNSVFNKWLTLTEQLNTGALDAPKYVGGRSQFLFLSSSARSATPPSHPQTPSLRTPNSAPSES
jgi:hypothetical protein